MKLAKTVKYTISAFFVLLCEQIFGKYIAIGAAVPMLSFCLCIGAAMIERDKKHLLWFAFIYGAVCDLVSTGGFGTYTAIFVLSSYITYTMRDKIFSSKVLFILCDTVILTLLGQCIYFVTHIGDIGSANFFAGFKSVMIPTAFYNMIVSLIMFPIFGAIMKKEN